MAQMSTNKQVFRLIQVDQVYNKPVPDLFIIVPMAHEMLKHQWNLQHGPRVFSCPGRYVHRVPPGAGRVKPVACPFRHTGVRRAGRTALAGLCTLRGGAAVLCARTPCHSRGADTPLAAGRKHIQQQRAGLQQGNSVLEP